MRLPSLSLLFALAGASLLPLDGEAQPSIATQTVITSTGARNLVDACLEYARKNNLKVGVAVVDPTGNLLDYHTMEGTDLIAGESAILKAKTAVRWWQSTEELNKKVKSQDNVAPVWIGDFPQEGGLPIFIGGVIVGGMGIGGGRGDICAKSAIASVLPQATISPPQNR
jgi:glc operon protein GlcG